MLPLFKYSLCLLLLVLVYGKTKDKHRHGVKQKRDIDDLTDDPLLTSIFKSDIQEKRKDRSVSPTDEKQQNNHDKLKDDLVKNTETDNSLFKRDLANSSIPIPSSLFAAFADNPIIGSQIPLGQTAKLLGYDGKAADEAAVVPSMFQANYMPLENLELANPAFQGETVESVEGALQKKSIIPEVPYLLNMPIVNPSMYSTDVIKKNDIPDILPGSEGGLDESLLKPDETMKVSDSLAVPSLISAPLSVGESLPLIPLPPAMTPEVKSTVDAPQVQNLDGALTRPIIKDDDLCSDQYATCNDFAKAEYCTKYPDLMRIQCRKSCGYCVAGQRDVVEEPVKPKGKNVKLDTIPGQKDVIPDKEPAKTKSSVSNTTTASNSTEAPTPAPAAAAEAPPPENATAKVDKPEVKNEVKNETKATKKSITPEAVKTPVDVTKSHTDIETKSKIVDTESGSTNEGDISEAESGDLGSGDLSGSGSGSGDEEQPVLIKTLIPENDNKKDSLTATATKATVSKAKEEKKKEDKKKEVKSKVERPEKKKEEKGDSKSKIVGAVKAAQSNLGEFTLPVIKSEVSTASLALNDKSESDESGSGSGSGEEVETAEEQKVPGSAPSKETSKKHETHAETHAKKQHTTKDKSAKKEVVADKAKTKAKVPAKKVKETKHEKSKIIAPKKVASKATKKSKKAEKTSKKSKTIKEKPVIAKKSIVPRGPKKIMPYPKIDLRLIASALAHYEEAALELAGEYPRQPDSKQQEVSRSEIPKPEPPAPVPAPVVAPAPAPVAPIVADTKETTSRSFIPHPPLILASAQPYFAPEIKKEVIIDPLEKYRQNLQIAKILTDDRNGRSTIPKYLRLTKDVHHNDEQEIVDDKAKADSLTSVQKRFNILGVEPTLIDYYAETGKINPFAKKKRKDANVKKSAINANADPYEYLRNMPAGASMLPIDDPKARSKVPSDHSYPVFLMKVSPGERKYIDELPRRRGEIRHLNAEGVEVDESTESTGIPKDIVSEMQKTERRAEPALKKTQLPAPAGIPGFPGLPGMSAPPPNPFMPNPAQNAMAMMTAAANLRNSLLAAQSNLPQQRGGIAAPKPKTQVPKPKPKPAAGVLTEAAAKAMEKSAISIGMQYAQSQMKMMQQQQNKLNVRARLPAPNPNKFVQALRGALTSRPQAVQRNRINFKPQYNLVKPGTGIASASSPLLNPAFALQPQVNENTLKNKMVSAFFPMKKDGLEGSGESG